MAHKAIDTFAASGSWLCPAGITSVDVECWGAGGGGQANTGGGGGGAYAKKNTITVTPGNSYTVTVGTGASNTNGGDSKFNDGSSDVCIGAGGKSRGNGGAGGTTAASTGDTKFAGGDGFAGTNFQGGGGGAGTAGNGSNGTGSGGNGGLDFGGKGDGGSGPGNLNAGGGGCSAATGFAGCRGEVRINYDSNPGSGFPNVAGRALTRTTANSTTGQSVNLPSSIAAGDLLMMFVTTEESGTLDLQVPSNGWNKLFQGKNGSNHITGVFWKIAEGSDPSPLIVDFNVSGPNMVILTLRITNAGVPISTIPTTGSTVNATFPAITLPESRKYLFIAVLSISLFNGASDITVPPAGYGDLIIASPNSTSFDSIIGIMERFATNNFESPTAVTSAPASAAWISNIIAIPNAAKLNQHSYRFRNDDGNEAAATNAAALNTLISKKRNVTMRVRVLLDATNKPDFSLFRLEVKKKSVGQVFKKIS